MLLIGPDNGAQRLIGSSLKFIVIGVFINGKMAVSLSHRLFFGTFLCGAGAGVFSSAGSAILALADDGEVKIYKNV